MKVKNFFLATVLFSMSLYVQAANFNLTIVGSSIGDATVGSATGLESLTQTVEYRKSNSSSFSSEQMPGIAKYGWITLHNVTFLNNSNFMSFYNNILDQEVSPATYVLSDINGLSFIIKNATPINASRMNLISDGNQVQIDQLEIMHDGLVTNNNP